MENILFHYIPIKDILEAGRWAPSGANVQPWRFLIVENRYMLKAMAELCHYKSFKSRHVAFEEEKLKNMLNISGGLRIIALIAFGYEIGKASTPPWLPLSSIIQYEPMIQNLSLAHTVSFFTLQFYT